MYFSVDDLGPQFRWWIYRHEIGVIGYICVQLSRYCHFSKKEASPNLSFCQQLLRVSVAHLLVSIIFIFIWIYSGKYTRVSHFDFYLKIIILGYIGIIFTEVPVQDYCIFFREPSHFFLWMWRYSLCISGASSLFDTWNHF